MLAGKRISIRRLEASDLEGDTEWACMDAENLRKRYEKSQKDKSLGIFVIINEERKPIGRIEYVNYRPTERRTQCNILLAEEYTGQGYGTEALRMFSAFLFENLDIDAIGLIVNEKNERAIRCYEKCNYKIRHRFPEKGELVMVLEKAN